MNVLWVQQVDIFYTKVSRGAPASTIRNQLARAFPMNVNGSWAFAFEYYRLLEWNDFAVTRQDAETAPAPPSKIHDLIIRRSDEGITLGLRWSYGLGQPRRHDVPNVLTVSPGETARLVTNGRFTNHSGQFYTEATYNVALGVDIDPNVFVKLAPQHMFDLRADLF